MFTELTDVKINKIEYSFFFMRRPDYKLVLDLVEVAIENAKDYGQFDISSKGIIDFSSGNGTPPKCVQNYFQKLWDMRAFE